MTRTLDADRLGDHRDRMYRAAWAMCASHHDAEDLVQDTYLRVLAKPRRIRGEDELGYLLTALRNTHINRHRATARRPQTTDAPEGFEPADSAAQPDERVRAREVFAWIAALPEELAAALVAVDVVGLNASEAAQSLGVSDRDLGHRLNRARVSLGRRLKP